MKRVMVDMSATLIHHGHVRLLRAASEHGSVVVGLTTDDELRRWKGYEPELCYEHRKEILEAISCVAEVVPCPWLLDDAVLDRHRIDLLVHGNDNSNVISANRLLVLPRTEGISSTELRERATASLLSARNRRPLFVPGTAVVLPENVAGLRGAFGRSDDQYAGVRDEVLGRLRAITGQDNMVALQGSATLALEIASLQLLHGSVLLVETGYYGTRLGELLRSSVCKDGVQRVTPFPYDANGEVTGSYDWVAAVYTETSRGFLSEVRALRALADRVGARLFLDATGSIGLEDGHELADALAFSSCKGLFGLTGAAFVGYRRGITPRSTTEFYRSLATHDQHRVTGPYHTILSLQRPLEMLEELRQRVRLSRERFLERFGHLAVQPLQHRPLLCTQLSRKVTARDPAAVLYEPREGIDGSVVCHLGDAHHTDRDQIGRIYDLLDVAGA